MPETKSVTTTECKAKHKFWANVAFGLLALLGGSVATSTWAGFEASHKVEVHTAELSGWKNAVTDDLVEIKLDIKQLLRNGNGE